MGNKDLEKCAKMEEKLERFLEEDPLQNIIEKNCRGCTT